ncbi:MAG: MOSC domain-containing protein [Planctomycetota bacterium]
MVTTRGRIKAISVSAKKGTQKTNVPEATLKDNFGIVGDAHGGPWHRQISLLASESIDKMLSMGANVGPGAFAENVTTEGIDLCKLSIGRRLKLGENVELEITQLGKKCHSRCEIFKQVGDCIMPREGIFAKVVKPGSIVVGDVIAVCNR